MSEERDFQKRDKAANKAFLVERQIRLMLATLIRDEPAFKLVRDQLQVDHFPADLRHYAWAWQVLCEHHAANETMPSEEQYRADLEAWISREESDGRQVAELGDLVDVAFAMRRTERVNNRPVALKYVQRFLSEAMQRELKRQVTRPVAAELPRLLQDIGTRVQVIESLNADDIGDAFPAEVANMPRTEKTSTGCDFLDKYMGGGTAPGEVYGLCAPWGVGKTLLSLQLSCNAVGYEQSVNPERPKRVYYFHYEEPLKSVQTRALAYEAQVEKTIIEDGRWDDLSTRKAGNYKPYERGPLFFQDQLALGHDVPGEKERLEAARRKLNINLKLVNFFDRKEFREMAANYVDGIAAMIERDQARHDRPGVGLVVVDYAGACADRYCMAKNLDVSKHLRHLIGKFPMRVATEVAGRFSCPAWIMHQLSTEANSKKAGMVPKRTDISEAHNFFENVTFGFLMGMKNMESLVVFTNAKQRREGLHEDCILKIDGLYSRIRSTHGMYRLDGQQIVRADMANRFAAVDDDEDEDQYQARRRAAEVEPSLDQRGIGVNRR